MINEEADTASLNEEATNENHQNSVLTPHQPGIEGINNDADIHQQRANNPLSNDDKYIAAQASEGLYRYNPQSQA